MLLLLFLQLLLVARRSDASVVWSEDVTQFRNESRVLAPNSPEWRYCDGGPSIPESQLHVLPSCAAIGEVQRPMLDHGLIEYALYDVHGMPFCCKSNYTVVLPKGTNVTQQDEQAKLLYDLMITSSLKTVDCTQFYPLRTCAACAYAYRSFICAYMFPMACASQNPVTGIQQVPICRDVCLEVTRKCPNKFRFKCPKENYRTPITFTGEMFANGSTLFHSGCNPMHYNL